MSTSDATRRTPLEHEVRALVSDDVPAMLHLSDVSFGGNSADDANEAKADRDHLLRLLPYSRGVDHAGTLAAVCRVYPFAMYLAGRRVLCGALAGVVSSPLSRRLGMVRALLHDTLERLAQGGVGWCLEYPFDPGFYGRYGFASVPTGSRLDLPPSLLRRGRLGPGEALASDSDDAPVKRVHAAFASRFSFTLARDDGVRDAWGATISRHHGGRHHHRYLLDDAYVYFHQESMVDGDGRHGSRIVVRDLAYASPAGRVALLDFLGAFDGQVDRVSFQLPPDDPLVLDRVGRYAQARGTLQVRIADLAAAFAPFAPTTPGATTLAVRDEFCPWNDGTFALAWGPEGTHVERSKANPVASLSVTALPALLVGAMTAEAAVAVGWAEGDLDALRSVASLNGGRPPYASPADFF